ncbi:MAG: hypothetical protein KGS72_12230 [Cyanobacteria bacterium REEB67]|nr:hypothetical protein [Cyanobacteria bacterium REEB67]
MTDHRPCSESSVGSIADDLNYGRRDDVVEKISLCTMDLMNHSDYLKTVKAEGTNSLASDAPPSEAAKNDFAKLATEEKQMFQSIKSAAESKNPNGLCKLTIEEGQTGPSADINGAHCTGRTAFPLDSFK